MGSGEHVRELGELNILRLIFKYSTPSIFSTVIDATYNLVDRVFVGRACGEDALAAVTVCFSPALLFLAIGMTIGHGSSTMVSIMLGKKNRAAAERYLGQAVFLFFVFTFLLAVTIIPNIEFFLRLFGATDKILPMASQYYSVILGGMIFEKISYGINNLIRAEGRPVFSMSVILICGLCNVVLDYVFLFQFGWGVRGAAIATVVSQALGSCLVVYFYLFSGKNFLRLRWENLKPRWEYFKNMVAAGSPSLVIQTLAALSTTLFILQAKKFGAEGAIAVIGVSSAVSVFLYLPVVGLSMGAQPIFGYNWGAGNFDRVREAFVKVVLSSSSLCLAGFVIVEIFAGRIYELFLGEGSHLVSMGETAIRVLVLMFPLIGANISASGYFQATKRPKFSIFVTMLRQLIFLAPLLIILPHYMGLDGVWWSFPIADFAAFSLTLIFILGEMKKLAKKVRARDL